VSIIFFRLLEGGRSGTIVGTLTIPAVMIVEKDKLKFFTKSKQNVKILKTTTHNLRTGKRQSYTDLDIQLKYQRHEIDK
jgi:hypothetical protein